jgi:hypothetical protein
MREEDAGRGVGAAPHNRYEALRREAAPAVVGVEEAAELCGVHPWTVYSWLADPDKRRLYGARKIGGAWFLDREKLLARKRAPYGSTELVKCSTERCENRVPRTSSQLRRSKPYCAECLEAKIPEWLSTGPQAIRDMDPDVKHEKWSEASRGVWADGKHDKENWEAAIREGQQQYLRRPARREEAVAAFVLTRYGRDLTPAEASEVRRKANSRKSKGKAGRKPGSRLPSYYAEWAAKLEELRDYHERRHLADPDEEPMPTDWALFGVIAEEDYAAHPDRWGYNPETAPRSAKMKVQAAITKHLQNAQTEIYELRVA